MKFDNYSPRLLRFAIERELQKTDDVKLAAQIAIARLKKNPKYYHEQYGFIEPENMEKARVTKYIRRIPKDGGGWNYIYKESDQKKTKHEKIKLKMRFDSQILIFNFNLVGFEERIGNEKTSEKALSKSEKIETNIDNFDKEFTNVIDTDGKILLSKYGNYDEINFDENEINKIKNSEILTHTHPEDKSFSVEDVFLALSFGIKELRVKTPNNVYFFKISHREKSNHKNELKNKNTTFMNIIVNLNNKVIDILREKVQTKNIGIKEAEKEHREMLWNMVKQSDILLKYFNIEYGEISK